jgi:hypothetical protein
MATSQENSKVLRKLKALGYHETMSINDETSVMRVPNGLIYTTTIETITHMGTIQLSKTSSGVFVAFD